jgi:ribosomal protein S3
LTPKAPPTCIRNDTPPVAEAGLYRGLADLKSSIERWRAMSPETEGEQADLNSSKLEKAEVQQLKTELKDLSNRQINIEEIRKPDLDAKLLAQGVAQQLERRVMFRRAMKRVVQNAMRAGAEGVKVQVSGRLGGAEIARTEWYREGRVPLHTLRADIDYATHEANTTYGVIGVKVWVFKGEIIGKGADAQVAVR